MSINDEWISNTISILSNSLSDPIYWKDSQNKIIGCNDAFEKFLNISDKKLLSGYNEEDILSLTDPNISFKELSAQSIDSKEINHIKGLVIKSDLQFQADFKASLLTFANSSPILLCVLSNTKLYRNFDDLLVSDLSIYKEIISSLPGYVYWKNIDSIYMGCNKNLSRESGLENPEDIIGKHDEDFFWGKEKADEFIQVDKKVIETGNKVVTEDKIPSHISKKGFRYIRTEKTPLFFEKRPVGVLAIAVDITAEKIAVKLRKQKEVMRKQVRLFKQLSATVAHELLTPLKGIDLGANSVKKYLPTLITTYKKHIATYPEEEEISEKRLGIIENTVQGIISHVAAAYLFIEMFLSNISARRYVTASQEIISIGDIIEEAIENYPFTETQKEKVHADYTDNFELKGNKRLLVHVLFNLFKNSLYYIEKAGKGEINIWAVSKKDDFNELHFKDTGQGISAEILGHIFDQFFTQTYHGTGIGLTFSKMIMESIRGNIECQSVEGEYAEFILKFPKVKKKKIRS